MWNLKCDNCCWPVTSGHPRCVLVVAALRRYIIQTSILAQCKIKMRWYRVSRCGYEIRFKIDADKRTDATNINLCCCIRQVKMFWVYFVSTFFWVAYLSFAAKGSIDRSAQTVSKQWKVTPKQKRMAKIECVDMQWERRRRRRRIRTIFFL